ncbi:hypothetical protein Q3G72_011815 [Acer saccharum]|nr:hypothetical protein Q3G72_011815 [Acer saccharum]
MSILGEVVLTASVELLLEKLTSSELLSFANQERIHDDLKKWENTLRKISAVLQDAEEKQNTSQSVNDWLFDLQNLAYDVEDLLDEFAAVALERKLTHQPAEASTGKVQPRTDINLGSLNPIIFSDFQGDVFQIVSGIEGAEIVGYKAPTSFWHSGIISLQDATFFLESSDYLYFQLDSLLEEKEEELQLRELPCICQYLVLDSVCLTKLPHVLLNLDFLRKICIANCSDLVSFPEATLPSHLRAIYIESCKALECLPNTWMDCTSLECLSVIKCDSLMYLARKQLSPNLKKLVIKSCNELKTLMQEEDNSLGGSSISATSSFSKSELPATLEHIEIWSCDNLAYLSSGGYNLPKALKYLSLRYCSKLDSVAERFHDSTCLKEIHISYCENLQLLPEDVNKLDHLEWITINHCPSLVSFPRGGLPFTNLTNLRISECIKLVDLPDNMHQLSHLQQIQIWDCSSLFSFPEGGFPSTNLTELIINLKCLSSAIQSLNSLEELYLENCPKLKSFPKKGLPLSLLKLRSYGCPLLKQNCEEHKGRYWPMIAYIPEINMDYFFLVLYRSQVVIDSNSSFGYQNCSGLRLGAVIECVYDFLYIESGI